MGWPRLKTASMPASGSLPELRRNSAEFPKPDQRSPQNFSVALDARKLRDGGIGVYIENLILGLSEIVRGKAADPDCLWTGRALLLARPGDVEFLSELVREHTEMGLWRVVPDATRAYSLDEAFRLGRRLTPLLDRSFVFHEPHYTLPFRLQVPSVVTVHDLIHLTHPEHLGHRVAGYLLIRSALQRASHVVAVSEYSSEQIRRLFPGQRHLSTVRNTLRKGIGATDEHCTIFSENGTCVSSADAFFLFVGSDRPHKGFRALIEAWKSLASEMGERTPKLVCIGRRYSQESRSSALSGWGATKVCFVNEVSNSELSSLCSFARAAVVPSREEGFGLPALEALACGSQVVATPIRPLREVCDRFAIYAADTSSPALAAAMKRALQSWEGTLPREREDRIAHANRFSREEHALETLRIYSDSYRRFWRFAEDPSGKAAGTAAEAHEPPAEGRIQ